MLLSLQPQLLLAFPSGGELMVLLVFAGIMLIPAILYVLMLQNTLKLISIENRSIEPTHVWLLFIPVFNLVWQFIVVNRLATSITKECNARNIPVPTAPGYSVGLVFCICNCLSWIPILGAIIGLVGFVCWIIHWVTIGGYKKRLEIMN